jgi:hypothetical protein
MNFSILPSDILYEILPSLHPIELLNLSKNNIELYKKCKNILKIY